MRASRAAELPPESEESLQQKVCQLARACGWRFVHFRPGRTLKGWRTAFIGDPGFPDSVLVRGRRLIFAELKSDSGKSTDAQDAWIWALAEVPGVETYFWRPSDWDEIVRILK